MSNNFITVEDLLQGASTDFEILIPGDILTPGSDITGSKDQKIVRIRPLTIGVFQLILKAARSDEALIPLLMVKEALIEPCLSLEQVKKMHVGLITFLVEKIRELSGMAEKKKS